MRCDDEYNTTIQIAMIRSDVDTADEFYSEEKNYYNEVSSDDQQSGDRVQKSIVLFSVQRSIGREDRKSGIQEYGA